MMKVTADVRIKSTVSLQNAAKALSSAFGVKFEKDESGRLEEFPAYRAQALGLELVLLGVPDTDFDVRETPDGNFALKVTGIIPGAGQEWIDLSSYFANLTSLRSELECWVPNA